MEIDDKEGNLRGCSSWWWSVGEFVDGGGVLTKLRLDEHEEKKKGRSSEDEQCSVFLLLFFPFLFLFLLSKYLFLN